MNWHNVPENLRGGLWRYIDEGILPGSFLSAVLRNDLKEACAQADLYSRYRLFDIVAFLYNEVPYNIWGSDEAVDSHIAVKRVEREVA